MSKLHTGDETKTGISFIFHPNNFILKDNYENLKLMKIEREYDEAVQGEEVNQNQRICYPNEEFAINTSHKSREFAPVCAPQRILAALLMCCLGSRLTSFYDCYAIIIYKKKL